MLGWVCVLHAQTPLFNITDIGAPLGTNSAAQAINNPGSVVGYWLKDAGYAAFLYQSNQVYEVAALGPNANFALSINDAGHVVGQSQTSDGLRAFYFDGASAVNLGDWGGTNSCATGISPSDLVAGYAQTTNGSTLGILFNGQPWDLGSLGGTTAYALGLNGSNVIVGATTMASGDLHAFRYDGNGMTDLNTMVQPNDFTLTTASAINSDGNITGWGMTNGTTQAFLLANSNLTVIPLLPGCTNGKANGINSQSDVVGVCYTSNGPSAFLWRNGTLYDLNAGIDPSAGWHLSEAKGINDAGKIVGWGTVQGEIHAFLLTPNQAPTVWITSPTNGTTLGTPTDLTVTASASDDVAVARADFYTGTRLIGSATTAPFTITWPDIAAGTYSLTAVAYDNLGASATSAVFNVTVTLPQTGYLKCWLRPEALSLLDGAPITNWLDGSGLGNNATNSTNSTAPIYKTGILNGQPAAYFNGSNSFLTIPSCMTAAKEGDVFIVLKPLNSINNYLWNITGGSSYSSYTTAHIAETFGLQSSQMGYTPQPGFQVYNVSCSTNSYMAFNNGFPIFVSSVSQVSFTNPPIWLGRTRSGSSSNYYGTFYISEFILYAKQLSDVERTSITKYLVNKYFGGPQTAPTPSSLVACPLTSTQVKLTWSWQGTTNWIGAKIERKVPGGNFSEVGRANEAFSFVDTVSPGQTYVYRVKPYNFYGDAPYSNESTVTTPQASSFPTGNLVTWLRADAGLASSKVYWMDQSGRGNNFTVFGSPTQFVTNGQTAVHLGTSNYCYTTKDIYGTNGAEGFFVLRAPAMPPSSNLVMGMFGTRAFSQYPSSSSKISDGFCSSNTFSVPAPDLRSWTVYNPHSQKNDWAALINGTVRFQTNAVDYSHGSTYIGTDYGWYPQTYFDTDISEILIFNKVLSVAERESVNAYLNSNLQFCTNGPGQVTNLHCTAISPTQIKVWWNPVTNATSYLLERQVGAGMFISIGAFNSTTTNYIDRIQTMDDIQYRVSAQNYVGTNSAVLLAPLANITSPANGSAELTNQIISVAVQPNTDMAANPSRIELYANGFFHLRWTNAPYAATVTSAVPRHWNLMTLAVDAFGNSRYSDVVGADTLNPIDSDGDGVPDYMDAFPYDSLNWLAPPPDSNDTTPPVITLTEP